MAPGALREVVQPQRSADHAGGRAVVQLQHLGESAEHFGSEAVVTQSDAWEGLGQPPKAEVAGAAVAL